MRIRVTLDIHDDAVDVTLFCADGRRVQWRQPANPGREFDLRQAFAEDIELAIESMMGPAERRHLKPDWQDRGIAAAAKGPQ